MGFVIRNPMRYKWKITITDPKDTNISKEFSSEDFASNSFTKISELDSFKLRFVKIDILIMNLFKHHRDCFDLENSDIYIGIFTKFKPIIGKESIYQIIYDKSFCFPEVIDQPEILAPFVQITRRKTCQAEGLKQWIPASEKTYISELIGFICSKWKVDDTRSFTFEEFKDELFKNEVFNNFKKNGYWFREEIETIASIDLLLNYYSNISKELTI
jgi:hypothetical protein